MTPERTVRCACGWVSLAVSRADALDEVALIRAARPDSTVSLADYRCLGCGGSGPYAPATAQDAPIGATLNFVIAEDGE
jgi:hypothetical protein